MAWNRKNESELVKSDGVNSWRFTLTPDTIHRFASIRITEDLTLVSARVAQTHDFIATLGLLSPVQSDDPAQADESQLFQSSFVQYVALNSRPSERVPRYFGGRYKLFVDDRKIEGKWPAEWTSITIAIHRGEQWNQPIVLRPGVLVKLDQQQKQAIVPNIDASSSLLITHSYNDLRAERVDSKNVDIPRQFPNDNRRTPTSLEVVRLLTEEPLSIGTGGNTSEANVRWGPYIFTTTCLAKTLSITLVPGCKPALSGPTLYGECMMDLGFPLPLCSIIASYLGAMVPVAVGSEFELESGQVAQLQHPTRTVYLYASKIHRRGRIDIAVEAGLKPKDQKTVLELGAVGSRVELKGTFTVPTDHSKYTVELLGFSFPSMTARRRGELQARKASGLEKVASTEPSKQFADLWLADRFERATPFRLRMRITESNGPRTVKLGEVFRLTDGDGLVSAALAPELCRLFLTQLRNCMLDVCSVEEIKSEGYGSTDTAPLDKQQKQAQEALAEATKTADGTNRSLLFLGVSFKAADWRQGAKERATLHSECLGMTRMIPIEEEPERLVIFNNLSNNSLNSGDAKAQQQQQQSLDAQPIPDSTAAETKADFDTKADEIKSESKPMLPTLPPPILVRLQASGCCLLVWSMHFRHRSMLVSLHTRKEAEDFALQSPSETMTLQIMDFSGALDRELEKQREEERARLKKEQEEFEKRNAARHQNKGKGKDAQTSPKLLSGNASNGNGDNASSCAVM